MAARWPAGPEPITIRSYVSMAVGVSPVGSLLPETKRTVSRRDRRVQAAKYITAPNQVHEHLKNGEKETVIVLWTAGMFQFGKIRFAQSSKADYSIRETLEQRWPLLPRQRA